MKKAELLLPNHPPSCYDGAIMEMEGRKGESPWSNLLRNLRAGTKMALLRRVTSDDLCFTAGDLVLLASTDLVLNLAVSYLLVGRGGSLNLFALSSFFFHLPLMLFCGLQAGKALSRAPLVTLVPVALVSLSIPIELCHGALEWMSWLPRMGWLEKHLEAPHYYRFFWWWTAAAIIFLWRLVPDRLSRRVLLIVSFALTVILPLFFFPRGDFWVSSEGENEGGGLHLTEEVLTAQSRLLDKRLAGLLPGGEKGPYLYFVGFAGDAAQDVFMRELTAVGRLLEERFGAAGRTVLLVNNPRTATNLPFATATNLELALRKVGRVMDRDNDVLFLFLTSHGSPDNVLTVENGPLELDGLTPEMVRRMLERSRITWKVLVVSACYAGGFIEPLKDEHTLIITAADAVHESFGCSYGEEFTWFGKAYFNEALRSTYSFTDAFTRARETIRKGEKERGETPSNPQIWVGEDMKRKLMELTNRFAVNRPLH